MKSVRLQFLEAYKEAGSTHSTVGNLDIYWSQGGISYNPSHHGAGRGFELYVSEKHPSNKHHWYVKTKPEQTFGKPYINAETVGEGESDSAEEGMKAAEAALAKYLGAK